MNQYKSGRRAVITGLGIAPGEKVVTNDDLAKIVETNDEWIRARTGIEQRCITLPETAASDLGLKAAQKALEQAQVKPEEIDLILVTTTTPDYLVFPSTAALIQNKLGAVKAGGYDLSAACTGFVYGLSTASAFIESGMYQKILLVCVDTLSKNVDWHDRSVCILFGDAAGALVLEAKDNYGVVDSYLRLDGSGKDLLIVEKGGSCQPITSADIEQRSHYVKMKGQEVFKFAVKVVEDVIETLLKRNSLEIKDIDYFLLHQANKRIIDFAVNRWKLDQQKTPVNIQRYGNTSSASIPILLYEMQAQKKYKKGDRLMTIGFGAGLTWGGNIIEWGI